MNELPYHEKQHQTEHETKQSAAGAYDGQDFDPAPSRQPQRVISIILLLIAVPLLFSWGRGEIAKWHLAAARNAQYQGDRAEALAAANRAAEWDPNSVLIQSTQSAMMLTTGDAQGAAELADQVLAQHRQEYESLASKMNHLRVAGALNQSAYSHALAATDLDSALANIDEAIAIRNSLPLAKDDGYASMLDTRGYLRYLVAIERRDAPDEGDAKEASTEGDDDQEMDDSVEPNEPSEQPKSKEEQYQQLIADALDDLETAVAIYKQALKIERAGIENDARLVIDHEPLKFRRRSLDESMSVLLHHRGLLYQAAGKVAAAEKDFDRAKQLGYDPQNGVW